MRKSGVILPIYSLPGPYGIGCMSQEAVQYAEFLANAGLSYWQILPTGVVNDSNSPYQSVSVFAGNPLLIDLRHLIEQNLLTDEECAEHRWGDNPNKVDYPAVKAGREVLLRRAFERSAKDGEQGAKIATFVAKNRYWVIDYARFMVLQQTPVDPQNKKMLAAAWGRDAKALKEFDAAYRTELDYHIYVQALFFECWQKFRSSVNKLGVKLIGDMPIYVAAQSADVWSHPEMFELDKKGRPRRIAGCPPDAFSATGQLWGNPLYNWENMAGDGYKWWIERLRQSTALCDRVRIDHFRAFEAYFSIPAKAEDATGGRWVKGPGIEFFRAMQKAVKNLDLIAEDLGTLTEGVHKLRREAGMPGMAVLQFAFDGDPNNTYILHNLKPDAILYTGTHDNDTLRGWYYGLPDHLRAYCNYYARPGQERPWWDMLGTAWSSVCELVMAQMQDFLGLDSSARTNVPSVPQGNWEWRMTEGYDDNDMARQIRDLNHLYGRWM